jgi:chemotaxis protein methyltransferase WspC
MSVPAALLALLRERTGLDPAVLGDALLERVWKRTLREQPDDASRLDLLARNGETWTALLDELVVPETWFFREERSFQYLQRWIRDTWMVEHPHALFNALSLPCATGEEAYSIAIVALNAGLHAAHVRVEARDISPRAIAAGLRAVYRERSVRHVARENAERFFTPAGDGLQVGELLRGCIHFQTGNVLNAAEHLAQFPVLFCRNLLIYLTPDARAAALETLSRLLAPGGVLFLGHADTVAGLETFFERLPEDGAFAYRRRARAQRLPTAPLPFATIRPKSQLRKRPSPKTRLRSERRAAQPDTSHEMVERARKLADGGELAAARALLIALLNKSDALADGWYLLGLVQSALGHPEEAALCYERTLALEPAHADASFHRALLSGEPTVEPTRGQRGGAQ